MRRTGSLLALLTLSTCDKTNDAQCEPSDEPSSLVIDNRSGVAVDRIVATACDGHQEQELVLPEGGIAFPSQATVELPGPGCWLLAWSGEACNNDPPYRTSTDVCGGDAYEWTISVEGRVCEGGW
ncbi:MAG: hypothetical protein KDK70_22340 [Myxococcales bacterium]|nr:hypothetical protein [Myxococcales bacterium]